MKTPLEQLKTFLHKYRAHDSVYNLVGMGDLAGKYFIDADYEHTFWACYGQCLAENVPVCLAEKAMNDSIPRLDLDIVEPSEAHRSSECLKAVVQTANNCLQRIVGAVPAQLVSLILGKPFRKEKLGIHIQWPMFAIDQKTMAQWLLAVRDELGTGVFKDLKHNPVDCASCNVPWLLYGSRKPKPGSVPYELKDLLDAEGVSLLGDGQPSMDQALQRLGLVDPATGVPVTGPLARLMTVHPCGRPALMAKIEMLTALDEWETAVPAVPLEAECGADLLREIVQLISHERCEAESRFSWKLGALIYRASAGSRDGHAIWDEWLEKMAECYSSESTKLGWSRFGKYMAANSRPALGLLKYFARTDDPEAYRVAMDIHYANSFATSDGGGKMTSADAATLCYKMMGPENFKFSTARQWYRFGEHTWDTWDTDSLKHYLCHHVKNRAMDVLNKSPTAKTNPKLVSFASKFDEPVTLNNVVDMLRIEAIDREFVSKLDQSRELIAFRNGVYDLDACVFRKGRPEDYLSIMLNCSYQEQLSWDHPSVPQLEEILESFFPMPDLREYMVDILAHVFVGNRRFKSLFLWVGGGDNGKSVFAKWVTRMLGPELATTVSTTVLTTGRARPGAATPELAALKNKRLVLFHEPGINEKLTDGVLKTLTGRDEIMTRGLYKDPEQITPSAIYVIVANHEPQLSNPDDQATWNRFRVCEFPSTFVDPGSLRKIPATRKEQVQARVFPMILEFEDTLAKLTDTLAWYLIERWKKVRNRPLHTPDRVTQATRRYRENNNILANFLKERAVIAEGSSVDFYEFVQAYNGHRKQKFKQPVMESRLVEELNVMPPLQVAGAKILNMAWNPDFRWDEAAPGPQEQS